MDYKALFSSLEKGRIAPVYIFTGPEEYIKVRALERLLAAAVDNLPEINITRLQPGTAQEDIIEACQLMPMMASRRAVLIKDCQLLLRRNKEEAEQDEAIESAPSGREKPKHEPLSAYMENPNPNTCLIFYFGAEKEPSGKLYKDIAPKTDSVCFKRVDEAALPKWIAQQFAACGKRVDKDAIAQLMDLCGTELTLLSNEILKIAAFAGDSETVNSGHVLKAASRSQEYSVFKMIDFIASRQIKQALEIAAELAAQGQDPVGLISLMSSHYHNLLSAKQLGADYERVQQHLGVKGFVAEKLCRQVRAYTHQQLAQAVRLLLDADEGIKSGQYNAELTLAGLIGRLAER